MSHTNGDAPTPDYDAVIETTVAQLREASDAATRYAAIKRNEYDEALDHAKRLSKALDALTPRPAKATTTKADHGVRETTVERVAAIVAELGPDAEFTASSLAKDRGMSNGTVGRALEVLREREVIRVSGARTGGTVYAPMPEA